MMIFDVMISLILVIIRRVTDASSGSMPVHSAKPPLSSEPSISSTTHSSQPRKSESPFLHLPHHRLPPFRQLDCLENLVSWLAAAHPLVISDSITSTGSSCLLPKMAVFLSWPAGTWVPRYSKCIKSNHWSMLYCKSYSKVFFTFQYLTADCQWTALSTMILLDVINPILYQLMICNNLRSINNYYLV